MLTDRQIKTEKPDPAKHRLIADTGGLYLKVMKSGSRSFVHRYTYGTTRPEVVLGQYPDMSLAEARAACAKSRELLATKVNPLMVKHAHQDTWREAPTVEDFIDVFRDDFLANQYEQPEDAAAVLRRACKPIAKKLIPDVTPSDINEAILSIVKRGKKVAANRSLPLMRKMFEFAILKQHRKDSPVQLQRKDAGGQEKPPRRQLQFEQIAEFLGVMRSHRGPLAKMTRLALQFELGTAKRGLEVVTLEWEHLNMATKIWDNPNALTKEHHGDHRVFLSDFTIDILREIEQLQEELLDGKLAKYVFLSPTWRPGKPQHHMARHSLSHAILDLHNAGILPNKFTPHTFRKTFSSRLADMGVMPHITEKCLDHEMTGVMAVYNLANYYPERKAAMELWGAKLQELSQR